MLVPITIDRVGLYPPTHGLDAFEIRHTICSIENNSYGTGIAVFIV